MPQVLLLVRHIPMAPQGIGQGLVSCFLTMVYGKEKEFFLKDGLNIRQPLRQVPTGDNMERSFGLTQALLIIRPIAIIQMFQQTCFGPMALRLRMFSSFL